MIRHLTATGAVFDPNHQVVLLMHHVKSGFWQFPGGHLYDDESPEEAARREVLEETGVRADLVFSAVDQMSFPRAAYYATPFMIRGYPSAEKKNPGHEHMDMLYLFTADATRPVVPQPGEAHDARWVTFRELETMHVRAEAPFVARQAWLEVCRRRGARRANA